MVPVFSGFSDIWKCKWLIYPLQAIEVCCVFDSLTDDNYFTHVHDQKESKLEPVFSDHLFMFIIVDPFMNFMH